MHTLTQKIQESINWIKEKKRNKELKKKKKETKKANLLKPSYKLTLQLLKHREPQLQTHTLLKVLRISDGSKQDI